MIFLFRQPYNVSQFSKTNVRLEQFDTYKFRATYAEQGGVKCTWVFDAYTQRCHKDTIALYRLIY